MLRLPAFCAENSARSRASASRASISSLSGGADPLPGMRASIDASAASACARKALSAWHSSSRAAKSKSCSLCPVAARRGAAGGFVSISRRSSARSSWPRCAAASISSRQSAGSAANFPCSGVAPVRRSRSASRRPSACAPSARVPPRSRAASPAFRHAARRRWRFRKTHAIDDQPAQAGDIAVGDIDQNRAFGAGFADAAALEIAGIDDPRISRDHLMRVDMAQRPVIVIFGAQVVEAARRVIMVAGASVKGGVQHADIEPAGFRRRIGAGDVFVFGAMGKAAAVQGDAQVGQFECMGLAGRKIFAPDRAGTGFWSRPTRRRDCP